ncbi:MAG: bifunctional diaminohydroxyphosphoribosylaminopyrimidine deaminase/5-amino-6-(5-phosphoribosylamino)uracil reductase RibD [Bdellovibrio sp.]|nr:bifunctional diaminohydroxyphosphoribosylaminopyrimidine deaminase/5-amino-6-(5-phosphoribosylamino)uracil reductase RibD [Bdellovibrio sp.]
MAIQAKGFTSPNPLVGAVLVKNNKIIGRGFHQGPGLPHAEVNAINSALGTEIRDSTLYCNLEPCCHSNKRTPPCVNLIIESGIKRVVVSNIDPNPFVQEKGIKKLREKGIEVDVGQFAIEGEHLNRIFFKNMRSHLPYITIKIASSLDGRICLENGSSKWITSPLSRQYAHQIRLEHDAIMVGINTFLADMPALNTRDNSNKVIKENKKIILGDMNKLKPQHWQHSNISQALLIHTGNEEYVCSSAIKTYHYKSFGSSLKNLMTALYLDGITSILVEGGQKVFSSFVDEKLYDDAFIFYAPIFLGNGKSNYLNVDISAINLGHRMKIIETRSIENNFLVHLRQE